MICLLSLIVFGVLAVFSAGYRPMAKEAFDCVFRRVTLRKCQSGLDIRVKSKIVGKVMNKSPRLAKGVHKYFEVVSWIFVILFFVSLAFSADAIYNLVVYDNCNGPDADPDTCFFTPDEIEVDCDDTLCEGGECEVYSNS
ncbi:hypothetical protein K8R33_01100 [archaeon]|nr:hypothetical protein [archaeon]